MIELNTKDGIRWINPFGILAVWADGDDLMVTFYGAPGDVKYRLFSGSSVNHAIREIREVVK